MKNPTPEKTVEETAKEIIAKVKHFAGTGQYPENPELEKAYLDGVNTAMAMLYIDLVGTPKSKGFLKAERQKREEMVEAERERILSNILKWSKTATVMETTGNEGAKRATKKLRENLYGSYHFLYQALKLNQTNNPE